MNIHFGRDESGSYTTIPTDKYRAMHPKERKPTSKGTQAPRTREGLSGRGTGKSGRMQSVLTQQASYPGGKRLRRSLARLGMSMKFYEGLKGSKQAAFSKPGSMR